MWTRRRTFLLAAPAAAAAAAGVWLALRTRPPAPPAPGPSRANFDRLREGMTRAEVEAVMGPAAPDLSSDTRRSYFIWKGPDGWSRVWLAGDPRTVRRLEFDPTPTGAD